MAHSYQFWHKQELSKLHFTEDTQFFFKCMSYTHTYACILPVLMCVHHVQTQACTLLISFCKICFVANLIQVLYLQTMTTTCPCFIQPPAAAPGPSAPPPVAGYSSLYPSLSDYMGITVTEDTVRQHVPDYVSNVSVMIVTVMRTLFRTMNMKRVLALCQTIQQDGRLSLLKY